jgi:hypothetical protein
MKHMDDVDRLIYFVVVASVECDAEFSLHPANLWIGSIDLHHLRPNRTYIDTVVEMLDCMHRVELHECKANIASYKE